MTTLGAALSPVAMISIMRMSGSFALRGLARAAAAQRTGASAAAMSATTTGKASSSSVYRLFASLFALPGVSRCYSGAVFVSGTDSDPEYSFKDYDVDALLASQQQPLAAVVLLKTFWKYCVLHEALHASAYFTEIDRLEQEEFERGGAPLQDWPPYLTGAREWPTALRGVARATGRETAVKLVRLALAGFVCSVSDDLSMQRSAFKLLRDAGKSAAAKRELAVEAAESLVAAASSSPSSTVFGRCAARSAARWRRGPALAAGAAATAFRSGFLFSLADFSVSAMTETAKALLDAAREAREESGESGGESDRGRGRAGGGGGAGGPGGEAGAEAGGEAGCVEIVPGRESGDSSSSSSSSSSGGGSSGSSSLVLSVCSSVMLVAKPLLEAARAFFGVPSAATPAALVGLVRSSSVALAYAAVAPSLVRGGASLSPSSSSFLVSGVLAGSLALAVSATALRAALGGRRSEALRAAVARHAVRCSAGLSLTSAAYGCGAVFLPPWTLVGVQLAADNLVHAYLVGPAMKEQQEEGAVGRGRAVALSAALAAGCVAAIGVL